MQTFANLFLEIIGGRTNSRVVFFIGLALAFLAALPDLVPTLLALLKLLPLKESTLDTIGKGIETTRNWSPVTRLVLAIAGVVLMVFTGIAMVAVPLTPETPDETAAPLVVDTATWTPTASYTPTLTPSMTPSMTPSPTFTFTPSPSATQTMEPTDTPTSTPETIVEAPTSTDTPTPSPTVTATSTLTPTATSGPVTDDGEPHLITHVRLNVRKGPGFDYGYVLTALSANARVPILGLSADGGWWRIECPESVSERFGCWVTSDPDLSTAYNTADVPVEPEPTPAG